MVISVFSKEKRINSKHRAYAASCKACGVAAYISEITLLKLLQKGLEQQNLQITAIEGKIPGTPEGIIYPLIRELRRKGIRVL